MRHLRWGISLLALIAMTAEVSAAACDAGASAALKTAAVQQELMVSGLTCHADAAYNRFVLADQPQLQKSDADLLNYFKGRDGNEAGYDSYKTKLANLAASTSAGSNRFCADTARAFRASEGVPLKDFIAAQHLLIAAPEACAVQYDPVEEAAVTGPSYSLPAAPFGAPASPPPQAMAQARRYEDPDAARDYDAPAPRYANANQRQASDAPPRPSRWQRDYDNQGWAYGPYGWYRPVRRSAGAGIRAGMATDVARRAGAL